jgi:hypothetical protein
VERDHPTPESGEIVSVSSRLLRPGDLVKVSDTWNSVVIPETGWYGIVINHHSDRSVALLDLYTVLQPDGRLTRRWLARYNLVQPLQAKGETHEDLQRDRDQRLR